MLPFRIFSTLHQCHVLAINIILIILIFYIMYYEYFIIFLQTFVDIIMPADDWSAN